MKVYDKLHEKVSETFAEINHGRATNSELRNAMRSTDIVIADVKRSMRKETSDKFEVLISRIERLERRLENDREGVAAV
jgi:5-bromo-4-chloroindolyl phosphate hydrolysis protein